MNTFSSINNLLISSNIQTIIGTTSTTTTTATPIITTSTTSTTSTTTTPDPYQIFVAWV